MKKIFLLAGAALWLSACNDATTTVSTDGDKDTVVNTPAVTTPVAYVPVEGDATYRNGKVMVWRGNDWVAADDDVRLDNGVIVRRNGRVERDNKVVVLDDGQVVSKTGRFFDKAGNAAEEMWSDAKDGAKDAGQAVKEGAKDAGQAVEKGAKKVGEEVKDVFKDDDKKKNEKKDNQ